MADKITWADKESLVTDPTIAEKNKVTDNNMNEIKSVTNKNADQLDETIVYDENDITTNTKALIKQGNYKYINSEIDNEYGTATNRGYSQEYINNTTKKITTSSATVDTTYISNTEQNLITRVGQLVEFDFIFTTTGTWTSTTKMFTGLPKPNTTTKIRFIALKTNPEVPLRFQLNADGSIQNGYSNTTISSGQIIEGHITYITID